MKWLKRVASTSRAAKERTLNVDNEGSAQTISGGFQDKEGKTECFDINSPHSSLLLKIQ